ncbi:hypothetical protein CC1G_05020 [Coprinopsis cinerea okayama7|uniref:Uncharacterized protein n=1 Tax=Coprinopsis cinerea (strain Okayama-7 / 130 / ATCC MYA-4618 / FGSC 9003) TaxID=240176 RepID=A8NSJ7_COPC7|nr:hypothetical protein CC1G_05020 [Coprinopsis cinerea okayama7\|eukprot:XP_001836027.1 hypothetical protein CC1G_05020 [Coprinopsis cinerea okayama7\
MSVDRGYTLLLNHLHNPATTLPLQTIQGALSHHLATISPSPTPLAATAISSPFYLSQPIDYAKLYSLSTAFRHASHLKFRALAQSERKRTRLEGLFKKSLVGSLDQWMKDVVKGVQGGHPVLRIACCSGLLLGLEDLKRPSKETGEGVNVVGARGFVEDEDIVALAEVMDAYTFNGHSSSFSAHLGIEEWEKEFQPAGQDLLSLALIFASQSFPLISQNKLKVLPLPALAQILTLTIATTFKNGAFLSSVSASVTLSPEHQVHISPSSAFAQTLQSITTSPLTAAISSISRFTSNVLSLMLDSPSSSHFAEDVIAVWQTLDTLREVTKKVERDWISTSLASVTDAGIAPDSKPLAKDVWTILKTLLFTVIMIADGALSPLIFIPPSAFPAPPSPARPSSPQPSSPGNHNPPQTTAEPPPSITPSTLALTALHALSHLSFVISQFGGVTSTGNGFEELKKTFYLSLDILARSSGSAEGRHEAEMYVRDSCRALHEGRGEGNVTFRHAKQAFTLASIEQLVPVIGDACVRDWVWGVCYPHLSDPSNRETFESSHSVILAIFASHAAQQHQRRSLLQTSGASCPPSSLFARWSRWRNTRRGLRNSRQSEEEEQTIAVERGFSTELVQRMVPFYAKCLIENSTEGRLSTPQLCMAYSALVRSACACGYAGSSELTKAEDVEKSRGQNVLENGNNNKRIADSQFEEDKNENLAENQKKKRGTTEAENENQVAARYTLGWYCVQMLLDTLSQIKQGSKGALDLKGKGKEKETETAGETSQDMSHDRVHRLHLTLISTISSLPLPLLARVLPEIYDIIVLKEGEGRHGEEGQEEKRKELVEEVFREILESVGDREKEYAMRWWYANREEMVRSAGGMHDSDAVSKEDDTQARL